MMALGLPVAFVILAQAASVPASAGNAEATYGPAPAQAPAPAPSPEPQRECTNQNKDPNGNEIVVCAIKPEGYRLPPDIVEARRLKKEGVTVRPRSPHETYANHDCAHVGPMGCRGTPTINIAAVEATAAEISKRMEKGQEVGSVFETEKSSTDYQLYQMAKKEREEKEAAAAAKAVKDKARAKLAAKAAARAAAQGAPASSTNN